MAGPMTAQTRADRLSSLRLVVAPLDFERHLLHEIRPEWDRRWLGDPVHVLPRSKVYGLDARGQF